MIPVVLTIHWCCYFTLSALSGVQSNWLSGHCPKPLRYTTMQLFLLIMSLCNSSSGFDRYGGKIDKVLQLATKEAFARGVFFGFVSQA